MAVKASGSDDEGRHNVVERLRYTVRIATF